MELIEILSWIMLIPAISGAIMVSGHPKRRDVYIANIFFLITNGFGLIFMLFYFHWGYFVFNIIMTIISIRGIWLNRGIRVRICKMCKMRKKVNYIGLCFDCWHIDLVKLLET